MNSNDTKNDLAFAEDVDEEDKTATDYSCRKIFSMPKRNKIFL